MWEVSGPRLAPEPGVCEPCFKLYPVVLHLYEPILYLQFSFLYIKKSSVTKLQQLEPGGVKLFKKKSVFKEKAIPSGKINSVLPYFFFKWSSLGTASPCVQRCKNIKGSFDSQHLAL